jgi:pantothenate kinase
MLYDSNSFWKGAIMSVLTFGAIHHVLSKMISDKDKRQHWKRINISTSFIHSIISSIISIYWFVKNESKIDHIFFLFSFIENPPMCTTDIISSFTPNAYLFISFEIG